MPNPIKAIKGGIQGVQVASKAITMNNQTVKAIQSGESAKPKMGPVPKKVSMTPAKVFKAFVKGAQNPDLAARGMRELNAFGGKAPGTK